MSRTIRKAELRDMADVVALARVCPAGTHMQEISVGRVITTKRGKGYGKQMMLHAIIYVVDAEMKRIKGTDSD